MATKATTKAESRFQAAVQQVLKWETVYDHNGNAVAENVSGDTGGLTKYGIDQSSHPGVDIRNLTENEAVEIYRTSYWEPVRADALPVPVGEIVFDIAVNNGRGRAVTWLQEAIGVKADGFIGPVTIAAASDCDPAHIATALLNRRASFYIGIGAGGKAKFLTGWLNRNNDLAAFAQKILTA